MSRELSVPITTLNYEGIFSHKPQGMFIDTLHLTILYPIMLVFARNFDVEDLERMYDLTALVRFI